MAEWCATPGKVRALAVRGTDSMSNHRKAPTVFVAGTRMSATPLTVLSEESDHEPLVGLAEMAVA